jgi:defect-in-organelle-trafficking protein DotC
MRLAVLTCAVMLFLTGCSSTVSRTEGDTDTLDNLQKLSAPAPKVDVNPNPAEHINQMREEALKDVAMSVGAQSGLHWRSERINDVLKQHSKELDITYDFNQLILDKNVLPPVLTEARKTLNLDSPDTIRIADQTYQIVSQAKFVTTPPTWRDYLWMDYPQPPIPDTGILPHNNIEKKAWQKLAHKGWEEGIRQADIIYSENLSRLERDYKGMGLYRKLRMQNIVSAPFVATTELGVTGGGSNLNVNDKVLKITALPALQPNSKRWKPVVNREPQ